MNPIPREGSAPADPDAGPHQADLAAAGLDYAELDDDANLAPITVTHGPYTISTDPARLDLDAIYGYIRRSYWAAGRPRALMARALRHSLNFGVYHGEQQVGLARVITDYATYVYLCDVFILEEHQGQGLGKWLIEVVATHPALQTARRWTLATRDAHGLYSRYGFTPLADPDSLMERIRPQPWEQR
ncbi:MAG TPA: GNAT family N-acetyltransferase [Caldilineaceae bacterium]|nr:GNAT family N-acetyltransferase [Caldilineaceae bacterium]